MKNVRDPGIGSFFPYPSQDDLAPALGAEGRDDWIPRSWTLVNSGRAALAVIVAQHLETHPHARLWVPSYYCWDVTRYIAYKLPVMTYSCSPTAAQLPIGIPPDDLLLITSYFGAEPTPTQTPAHQVVLDVTHDPLASWIPEYQVGWLFGSLRKTLPMPEGGFAETRVQEGTLASPLPGQASRIVARRGVQAMCEKARWVASTTSVPKQVWYQSLQEHEAAMADLAPEPMQPDSRRLLGRMPVQRWRERRLANLHALHDALTPGLKGLALPATFGLPLVLPNAATAARVRQRLIDANVYAARIWPQPDDADGHDRELAERILFVHTDHRYSAADMARVAGILNAGDLTDAAAADSNLADG